MPASKYETGNPKSLRSCAKFLIEPADVAGSDWPELAVICRDVLGIRFARWQDDAANLILARRVDGRLAATVGGVGISLPRQVGKTFLLVGVIASLALRREGFTAIWTAHHERTHLEVFMLIQSLLAGHKGLVQRVLRGSGREEIAFANGSRIMFGARERGLARGFSDVDALMFDEAQIMSERALQNMLAAMNLSDFGLHCYVGTPPKPSDPADVFGRMRAEALSGESSDGLWIECGADDDARLDDRAQWGQANPSYPFWTGEDAIKRLRRKLDADGFRREALGIWPSESVAVFDLARWVSLEDTSLEAPDYAVLAVDVSAYRKSASIGVAGEAGDGRLMVMVFTESGTGWVVPKVVDLVSRRNVGSVCLTAGEARALGPDLMRAGVEFKQLTAVDAAASCTAFQAAVAGGSVCHAGQRELDSAVVGARTRRTGNAETWDLERGADMGPLIAAAAALYRFGLTAAPMPAIY